MARLYGADVPDSLASSGPRGTIVIEYEDRAETLEYTGELPLHGQQQLLLAAERFIPRGAGEPGSVAPTLDERYSATSFGHRLLDFGALLVKVLVLLLPFWAVMVIRIWMEGHLDRTHGGLRFWSSPRVPRSSSWGSFDPCAGGGGDQPR